MHKNETPIEIHQRLFSFCGEDTLDALLGGKFEG